MDFVDTYTKPEELGIDGVNCFRLRGGLVHRGDLRGHVHFDATHVIFSLPETKGKISGLSIAAGEKTAAMLDLEIFVASIDKAVRSWYEDNFTNEQLKRNLPNLIRYSSDGVLPFTKGLAAIVSGA